jgi:hypothetical protein
MAQAAVMAALCAATSILSALIPLIAGLLLLACGQHWGPPRDHTSCAMPNDLHVNERHAPLVNHEHRHRVAVPPQSARRPLRVLLISSRRSSIVIESPGVDCTRK